METILIGEVIKPHGIKGELKIYPITHDPARFKRLSQVILTRGELIKHVPVQKVRLDSGLVYLILEGINTIEEAEAYRGWEVRIERSDVPPLQEGWYYFELEGMEVYEQGIFLGTLISVLETGANDVYLIRGPQGEFYIPALKTVVKDVDVAGKRMEVTLPPGLLEDE